MAPAGIVLAFILDLTFGDPMMLPHPVKLIGKAVGCLESAFMKFARGPASMLATGAILALSVLILVYLGAYYLLAVTRSFLGDTAWWTLQAVLAYTTLSVKGLAEAGRGVYLPVVRGDLKAARKGLSMVVGRDTAGLEEKDIVRGTVESVAENASDGVVAPLFYMAIGGAPLALLYKSVNTMDSMLGYKNERYVHFGRAAARLDDLLNLVPARLTAALMVAASALLSLAAPKRYSWKGSWRVLRRDGKNHSSPNSGYPEAAAAGALGVRLGGENSYFGVRVVKPYIGDPDEPLSPGKIKDSVMLMHVTSFLALVVSVIIAAVM